MTKAFDNNGSRPPKQNHPSFVSADKPALLLTEDMIAGYDLLLISRNYGELRTAQQALMESEESYRRILNAAPYSIIVTRLSDSRCIEVNKAFCRRTGYSREEAEGHTPYELGIWVDPTARERMLEMFYRDGYVDSMALQFRAKDGTILESLFSVTPITYKREKCLLAMTVDIGELKAAQGALKESEERYRNILKNIKEGYWATGRRI